MHTLFHWFYCLPIFDALLLVLLAMLAFGVLRNHLSQRVFWRPAVTGLFLCWIGVILLGTLGNRTAGAEDAQAQLIPFYSYYLAANGGPAELYRENFMNAVLFCPAGLLGCEVLPKRWNGFQKAGFLVSVALLFSIGIEYCQYRFAMGLAETDDVIHNLLGTCIGIALDSIGKKNQQSP